MPSRCCSRCTGGSSRPTVSPARRGASSRGSRACARSSRSRSGSSASAASAGRWRSACASWSARSRPTIPPPRPCPTACPAATHLDELLESSDLVSLHLPLLPATEKLLGAAQFERMRSGALLVNVSRGALIDEDALADALEARSDRRRGTRRLRARAAASDARILAAPNTLLSPHVAWFSTESGPKVRRDTVEAMIVWIESGTVPHGNLAARPARSRRGHRRRSLVSNYLVTGAYGCIGAWAVRLLLDEGHAVTDLRPRRQRPPPEAAARRCRARGARPGARRRDRPAPAHEHDAGARDHARDPPRGAAGAVRAREPAARRERQRRRDGRRLRGRARARAARRHARVRLVGRGLRPAQARPRVRAARHPGHALRRLQACQRGDGRRLLGRPPDAEHRPAAAHGLRPRPRSGRDVGSDEGDARGRERHVVPGPLRRTGGAAARARRRTPVHRHLAHAGRGRDRCSTRRAARWR